jgi:hypothetical protein
VRYLCQEVDVLNSHVASGVNFDKLSPARAKHALASEMGDSTPVHGSSFAEDGGSLWDRSFDMIFSVIASETSWAKSKEPVSVTIFTVLRVES